MSYIEILAAIISRNTTNGHFRKVSIIIDVDISIDSDRFCFLCSPKSLDADFITEIHEFKFAFAYATFK